MEPVVEMRRYPRKQVFRAVMVSPNGRMHPAYVSDLSLGGARMSLPDDWTPETGMVLKISFSCGSETVQVLGRIVHVAVDHMGISFEDDQDPTVLRVLEATGSFH